MIRSPENINIWMWPQEQKKHLILMGVVKNKSENAIIM